MQPSAPNDDKSVHGSVEGGNARGPDESDSPSAPIVTRFGVLPPLGELVSRLFQGARRAVMGLCGLVWLFADLTTSRAVLSSVVIVVMLPALLWWIL